MAMNRTEGYYKAFIEVHYTNALGFKQHVASFQIATSTDMEHCSVAKKRFNEEGESSLAPSIQAYLASMRENEYDLIITSHLMV